MFEGPLFDIMTLKHGTIRYHAFYSLRKESSIMNDRQAQIEGMLYTHKIAMLSKVLWKNAESDWQRWLKIGYRHE